jgi:hypothetical protein
MISYKIRWVFTFILLMSVLFASALVINQASAQATTLELVNPVDGTHDFNFTTGQKAVGDTFTINISVFDVQNLITWQVKVGWDPTLLNFSGIALPADHIFKGKQFYTMGPTIEPGAVTYALALATGQTSFTGSGRLAQLTLKIIKPPSPGQTLKCNITFLNVPMDTFLLNSMGMDISFTTVGARYFYSAPWIPPPPATLYIQPLKIVDPTLTEGSKFNVSLNIREASDLHSWKAKILCDKAILKASEVFEGDFLKTSGSTIFSFAILDYDATHEAVDMNCTLMDEIGVSGNGTLATITFEVVGLGASSITIVEAELRNSLGLSLPFTSANGYFNNLLIAKLSIDPSEVRGPQYVPGTSFIINVTIDDVDGLKTYIFNLTYVPSVIQGVNIIVPPVLGQIPTKKLVVDDEAGYIWARLTYTNITTYEPITIMTINFTVVSMGISPINLTSTQLYDINGQLIFHEVYHGIFIGLIRDVAVTQVMPDLSMAYQGWDVLINATVRNKGNLTETFDVQFYFGSNLIGKLTVENLAPNEELTITITWETKNVTPCHEYTIKAKIEPLPYEMNVADNELTDGKVKIRWMGDVNGDGTVDSRDITDAILAFRTYPGRPGWNPEIDLDRNKIIDARDIVIIIINFNRRCT